MERAVTKQTGLEFHIWERVQLRVGDCPEEGCYDSRIEDIRPDGIAIGEPAFVSGRTLLRDNQDVTVCVSRKDAIYQFKSQLTRHQRTARPEITLTYPIETKRIQRRRFARLEVSAPVRYAELTPNQNWVDLMIASDWRKAESIDISGGGACVRTKKTINPGQLALLQIDLQPETDLPPHLIGLCRRTYEHDNRTYSGFEFVTSDSFGQFFTRRDLEVMPRKLRRFDPAVQDRFVTYLFRRQVDQRQRGLI